MNRKLILFTLPALCAFFLGAAAAGASPRITNPQPSQQGPQRPASASAYGVQGTGSGRGFGVLGYDESGVYGTGSTGRSYGVYGSVSSGTQNAGVFGLSSATNGSGVKGQADYGSFAYGVWGKSAYGTGLKGESMKGLGVYGTGQTGIYGAGSTAGIVGYAGESGTGVYGATTSGGYAGYFQGDVRATGACCASAAGTYQVDDPLDPANKYLNLSAVESADMLDILSGNATTDARGYATITLPAYFEDANTDFRYQLTVIGRFAQAIVATKIKDGSFTIRTDKPNVELSWQVTGVRRDPYAEAHRIPVEQDKPTSEKGYYLHPELYGQGDDKNADPNVRNSPPTP